MNTPIDATDFDFGGPATHRVVVQGTLSQDWYSRLGGSAVPSLQGAYDIPLETIGTDYSRL